MRGAQKWDDDADDETNGDEKFSLPISSSLFLTFSSPYDSHISSSHSEHFITHFFSILVIITHSHSL